MNPIHRKALRQCRTRLKEDLDDVLPVVMDLADVLTPAEMGAVASRTTRTDQAELLLQILDHKGPRAYPALRKSMGRRYMELGEALDLVVAGAIGRKYGIEASEQPSVAILAAAIEKGYHGAVKELVDAKVAFSQRYRGLTPIEMACVYNRETSAIYMYEKGARLQSRGSRTNALHLACSNGSLECATFVLLHLNDARLDIDAKDHDGYTALHHAAASGNSGIVDLLLKHCADMSVVSKTGETALHRAAALREPACANALLIHGAAPNARGGTDDETPLHIACKNNSESVMRLLLEQYDADPDIGNKFGQTSLHVCIKSNHASALEALFRFSTPAIGLADEDGVTGRDLLEGSGEEGGEMGKVWEEYRDVLEAVEERRREEMERGEDEVDLQEE